MTEPNEEFLDGNAENEAETNQTPPEIDSKYRMIILAAQRSKQLQRGADPRKTKSTRIAMKELEDKKVNFEILNS